MRIEDEIKSKGFVSEKAKAVVNVMFTSSYLHAKISCQLRSHSLSHEQFNVLRILKGQHPKAVAQKDILHRMVDRNSNLTRIIAKLKEKGLVHVSRSETDRREYEISITPEAIGTLDVIDAKLKDSKSLNINLSESELFHLNALLDKMREER